MTLALFFYISKCCVMTSGRIHRTWLWQLERLPVLSVSRHVGIRNQPPSGGKIKLVLTSRTTGSQQVNSLREGTPLLLQDLYTKSHTQLLTLTRNCHGGKGLCIEPGSFQLQVPFLPQVRGGKLTISNTKKSDSGIYVCAAANMVGERDSEKAQLSVFGKKSDTHICSVQKIIDHSFFFFFFATYII